jgi:hypothetical protein
MSEMIKQEVRILDIKVKQKKSSPPEGEKKIMG